MSDEVIADLAPHGGGGTRAAAFLSAYVLQTLVLQIDSFIPETAFRDLGCPCCLSSNNS
jgi:hypothetical protein